MKAQRASDMGNDHFCDTMPNDGVAIYQNGLWEFGVDAGAAVAWVKSGSICPFCKTDLIEVTPE